MKFHACGLSVNGAKSSNEDHFSIGEAVGQASSINVTIKPHSEPVSNKGLLLAVADGIGSYPGGELASRTTLQALAQSFYALEKGSLEERLRSALKSSLKTLTKTLKKAGKRKAGTTIAGLVLQPPSQLIVFHIGDSRALLYRDKALCRLTVDHTPIGEPLARGKITLDQALAQADSHHLTRSYGLWVNTRVTIRMLDYQPGDCYVLATDGVSSPGRGLDEKALIDFLERPKKLKALLRPMLKKATKRNGDNATLVLLKLD